MFLLYDDDCGFCRWSVVAIVKRSPELIPVAIQSAAGQRMLEPLAPEMRLASAHTVGFGGIRSGGDAVIDVLGALPRLTIVYKVARALPAFTNFAYKLLADQRSLLGKLISQRARAAADDYLRSATGP